ncbi:MAG TPA: hypothetical protein VHF28_05320, partial [Nitrososphaera sp.]|nr:hypothetical protein [Nitrososphaera sp.]
PMVINTIDYHRMTLTYNSTATSSMNITEDAYRNIMKSWQDVVGEIGLRLIQTQTKAFRRLGVD